MIVDAMCELTGHAAENGACPVQGGDNCLFRPLITKVNYDHTVADLRSLVDAAVKCERKRLQPMVDLILDTAHIEEWRDYTGDLVYRPGANQIKIVWAQLLQALKK